MVLYVILLVFALVFAICAGSIAEPWRWRLLCYSVACLAAALLFEKAGPLLVR